jgi:putative flippase GtrA
VPTRSFRFALTGTWRLLARELSAFGVVGATCFVLDLALFQLLYVNVGLGAVTAKLVATLTAMTAAYIGHRFWSFAHRASIGTRRGYVLFLLINGLTLALGLIAVALVRYGLDQESFLVLQITNVASIALGTAIRWLSYRRWVFPAYGSPQAESAGHRKALRETV